MPYNKEHLFIHIPRTGGTSIEEAMRLTEMRCPKTNPSPQHLIASEVKKKVGSIWDTHFTFSVVRDPIERLVSEFGWRLNKPFDIKLEDTEQSFNDFLLYAQKVVKKGDYSKHTFDHFRPQHEFLDEELDKIFTNLYDLQIYFKIVLPHLNASETNKDIVSQRNIELIEQIYEKDFNYYSG